MLALISQHAGEPQSTHLSVCKDSGIVSLEAALDETLGAVRVDAVLLGGDVKDVVVGEGFVLSQEHLRLPGHHIRADVAALDLLSGQLRTDPGGQKVAEKVRFLPHNQN